LGDVVIKWIYINVRLPYIHHTWNRKIFMILQVIKVRGVCAVLLTKFFVLLLVILLVFIFKHNIN